jgi:hypothetical protein
MTALGFGGRRETHNENGGQKRRRDGKPTHDRDYPSRPEGRQPKKSWESMGYAESA